MLSLVASRGAGSLASVARLGWHLQGSLPGAAPAATHDPEDASRISSGQSASCSSATGGPTGAAAANLGPQPHAWMLLRALSTSASASFCGSAAHMMPSPSPAASSTRRVGPALHAPEYAVGLHNLRDNPGATRPHIRVGRGDSARRGNYAGRGMKGKKARGRSHILYDGGQLGLIKFPVTRERPPYEVLYNQLGVGRLIEWIQLGLLDHTRPITMKDLWDSGCVPDDVQYGVQLYGKAPEDLGFPIHIQVTACEPSAREAIEAAGGSVTRVYYTADGLRALMHPERFLSKGLPLPRPPPGWHPKHEGKFDAVGQLPPLMITAAGGAHDSILNTRAAQQESSSA